MTSQQACINMVKQQLRTGDVLNERILTLYETIPRHEFVPSSMRDAAYSDMQIPLPHEQRMMTPLEEATLLQALMLKGHEKVLEAGTGSGYLTALLSHLCKEVISVEYFADLTTAARHKLEQHACHNVELITGDACRGWVDKAPFDVMIFSGALEQIEELQYLQLADGGKLVAILGKPPVMQAQLHTFQDGRWQVQVLFETSLPPLIDVLKHKEFVF